MHCGDQVIRAIALQSRSYGFETVAGGYPKDWLTQDNVTVDAFVYCVFGMVYVSVLAALKPRALSCVIL